MQERANNKQMKKSKTKRQESAKKSYAFPKYNLIINASSREAAVKELRKRLGGNDD